MIKTLVLLSAMGAFAAAQQPEKKEYPVWESKIVQVKHLTAGRGNSLAVTVTKFLEPKGNAYYDSMLDTFVVKGTPEAIAQAEKLIARFDVPEAGQMDRQVSYTAYVIEGSADGTRGQPMPATLEPVVQQMRATFPFKGYRLVDTIAFTGRTTGATETSGFLPAFMSVKENPVIYQIRCGKATVGEDAKSVSMKDFRFGLRTPYFPGGAASVQYADTGINTDLSVREGQKLVIGKLSAGASDSAIFLVVTAKID